MSNLAQFVGGNGPVTSIVNFFSAGGVQSAGLTATASSNTKETLSGAVTAATLKRLVNLTGRGRVNLLTAYAKDATARTIRCQFIVDGVTIFDATSSSVTAAGAGLMVTGVVDTSSSTQVFQPIDFYSSCEVWVASSLTETDKAAVAINYETWA